MYNNQKYNKYKTNAAQLSFGPQQQQAPGEVHPGQRDPALYLAVAQ